jgi:hypothetical protein
MFFSTKKPRRSGVLLGSVGQCVGVPADRYEQLCLVMDYIKFLPFGVVNLDPQSVCLAFQSPPAMNLGPMWLWKVSYSATAMPCLGGGLYSAAICNGQDRSVIWRIEAWILSG